MRSVTLLLLAILTSGACGGGSEGDSNNGVTVIDTDDAGQSADAAAVTPDGGAPGADASTVQCGEPTGMRPPRLSEHAGAFVPGDGEGTLVIFGGSLGVPENCNFPQRTYETTTWLYDVQCDSWSQLAAGANPAGRTRHTAVYDSAGDRVVIFGGLGSNGKRNDTWAFDMETRTWSELQTTGGPPPARLTHAAAYDPGANRMLVFGGNLGSVVGIAPANDMWALDLETLAWAEVTPAVEGPEPRLWVSALWDNERSQFVLFGGGDDSAFTGTVEYFDDVWAFSDADGTATWQQLDAGATDKPDGRFWGGWAYDPTNQRYVLFGGHDDTSLGNRNDTWFFDPASGAWSQQLGGDVPNKPPNGTCDFPADFTVIEVESPERRNAHVFASGATTVYAMGGKTDCGVIDDLVRFDFQTGEWEVLTRATIGEVCLRKGGGDSCSSLCL